MSEFEELVDAHYKPLYLFAYSLAKNPDGAADLVQQTFCIWAQKGHQLKDRSKAKTWLFTTLFREHLALSRRQKRYSDSDIDEIEYQLPPHEEDSGRGSMENVPCTCLVSSTRTSALRLLFFIFNNTATKRSLRFSMCRSEL